MDKSRILAHVGLGLVSYIPLLLYILFVLIWQRDAAVEVFTTGVLAFVGFFATTMTMFGAPLVAAALAISVWGLITRRHVRMNTATAACCLAWIAAGYWVLSRFR